jgi:hypothetical protein
MTDNTEQNAEYALTDNEVFDFCQRARAAGYAITAFTPDELRGCDCYEVTDHLVSAGNEYIGDYGQPVPDDEAEQNDSSGTQA